MYLSEIRGRWLSGTDESFRTRIGAGADRFLVAVWWWGLSSEKGFDFFGFLVLVLVWCGLVSSGEVSGLTQVLQFPILFSCRSK